MRKWTKTTTATIFLAAVSVYPIGAVLAGPEKKASDAGKNPNTEVRLLDETAGPVADPQNPQPTSVEKSAPATQPATQPVTQAQPAPKAPEATSISAQQVNVSDAGTVEIHVNEANLVEVLRMLSMQSQKNIIASKDVRGTVTANLYNVTIREALDAILKANGFGYQEKGNFIYVYTAKELEQIQKAERQTVTEVIRLYYTPAASAVTMIKPAMSTDAQVSFTAAAEKGVSASATDTGGNSHADSDVIIVRDYPENIDRIKKIIKEIDRRPQQILVEATIIAARLTEDNALGVDFTVLGGLDFNSVFQTALPNVPSSLTGQVLNTNANTGSITDKGFAGSSTNFSNKLPKDGIRVGVVSNNIAVFLTALEEVSDTSVLANPKVLTLNKQRGEVLVGREDGYLTTTVTDTTAVQTVEFLKTGTRLIFRPYIGEDGYIRMEVHPEDSDGKVIGGLPSKTTTEVTTNVMVKDGHTVVIGGLFREGSTRGRSQVPGLGNLPVVGNLFRSQQDNTIREEIIILLTPHIIKDDKAYSKLSEEAMKEMEKLRVGVRKGMMPLGRERLAESVYQQAVTELAKPTPDRAKALWYLDCATNLNPMFIEAMKMKEELTGKQLSAVDNSTVRSFVRRNIMAEKAASAPTKSALLDLQGLPEVGAPATQPSVVELPETVYEDCADAEMQRYAQYLQEQTELAQAEAAAQAATAQADKQPTASPATQPSGNGENANSVTEIPDESSDPFDPNFEPMDD